MKYNKIEATAELIDCWFLVGENYKDMNTADSTKWNMNHLHGDKVEFRIYERLDGVIEMWGRRKQPDIGFNFKQRMDDLVDEVLSEHA